MEITASFLRSSSMIKLLQVINMNFTKYLTLIVTLLCTSLAMGQVSNSVQEAPVALNDEATMDEDTSVTIDILANDTDTDGDLNPTSVIITTEPVFGTATVNAITGEVTYTPDPDFFGWDAITYQVSDLNTNSASATINITVNGINDAPTSADRTITIEQNATYTFSGADVAYNDVDGDCFNGFKIVTELTPDLGELYYDGDPIVLDFIYIDPSLLSFVPTFEASGTTEFDFRVVDDQGAESENYTMTIIIEDVNNNPSAENIVITMPANTVHDFSTELVYSDAENDPMSGFVLSSLPGKGQLSYNMGTVVAGMLYTDFTLLSFTPDPDESGEPYTSFTFIVEDMNGAQSADILVTVNVIPEDINLLVSEGFSPNGDDINDLWYIRDIDKFPNNRIQIYNRWGSLVKTFQGYDNESRVWRGESDAGSQQVTDGSYFYVISLGDGSAPLQGYVVLHR
jgi:gliding motility-associated-like protein